MNTNEKTKIRKPQLGIEMNDELVAELKEVAKKIQVSVAQIVREGTAARLVEIKKTHPVFKLQNN